MLTILNYLKTSTELIVAMTWAHEEVKCLVVIEASGCSGISAI